MNMKQENYITSNLIDLSDEVKEALSKGKAIVALESTIISHGMPYPQNLDVAKRCEQTIRDSGCTPATIAIIKGRIKVGLNEDDLEYLAKTGRKVTKVSRRDIPYVIAKGLDGATTVAGTMLIASIVGIKVFATGGIGGVHRGASETFDVSADLDELANTKVCVVCAGAKAILDIPKTLEYLETKGVMVITYKTDYIPLFYTSKSDYLTNIRLDSPKDIAKCLKIKWDLNLSGGALVANPIPKEFELDPKVMNDAIDKAINEMNEKKIIGKETTPFLLQRISEITQGDSLDSNIHLVLNNCMLASQIAKELYNLK